MRIQELLLELADKPAPYQADYCEDDACEINAPSIGLSLYLTRGSSDQLYETVIIEFSVNGKYNLTGEGGQRKAIQVLSTVENILAKYLRSFLKPLDTHVTFSAEKAEPSRVSLYRKAVPRITRILKTIDYNWEFVPTTSSGSLEYFTWSREKNKR